MKSETTDTERVWNGVLQAMKLTASEAAYTTYLKPTILLSVREREGSRLICEVGCPSSFIKSTLEQRYWGQLAEELERVTGQKCEVIIRIESRRTREQESESSLPLFNQKTSIKSDGWKRANLRGDFTFDNYAVAGSNQLAFAAAQAVARKPGEAYNPLFIYGGVGVGKTHLMQAIGHEVIQEGKGTVLFCSGEDFTNDLVEAIRYKSTEKVRAKYRKVKLLLIDDVQFIAGKQQVQEEFFHTFNALQREGGQVVMTSDRPPSEISKLEERLKSRFGAGLIADVGPAGFELRTAILLIKSKQLGIPMEMETAQIIAGQIEGVRELQGFLSKMITDIELNPGSVNHERLERLLKIPNTGGNGAKRIVTPSEVISVIGDYYGVAVQQLKGERRTKTIAWPRQVAMYFLRNELKLPFEEVGRLIGGRDHTTIIHGSDKVKVEIETNDNFRNEVGEIKKRILGG
ncbi:MAG: Chromosomal replication initiator protein DnaA [Candidatus Amesbacteria bacterium GW2011_GWA1_47_16]|uniref:Chromosomal replication initiator protein DnaA n=5 Tax=Candidatus Amesiibacteriota TaxID=1752730 RepID=A0A1F4ZVL1_9BACT|nr:MAG: Chromosomal replication initiator protein DnaA [Candidatus Amesbacteria bacterium GW2011_GWC1_47_15]KKU64700.1 MAG: Chromosomal replication initiator protein DnaA [Candidatus Amesbacteria bacterium GW2011_GWA1_47_16]KKU98242.1 MAG: Chromosomal replication initiator protein DnaA [Candidatus Amesbacteria bacterium GW2011_GWB1_48_13]OGC99543.1 MAG: chromosomal replication initiator protein DnaA [Candidatus Amesbacteria bacterium RIFCSPHIGHO2_01_FULL_47_34]OGD01084.1 MAG: chromosomal replic